MSMVIASLDPTNHWKNRDTKTKWLIEAMGLIPAFVSEVAQRDTAETPREVMDQLVQIYGFGSWESSSWGTLDSKGVLISPEGDPENGPSDPPLHPYASLSLPMADTVIYIYPYAIVAVAPKGDLGNALITRMD